MDLLFYTSRGLPPHLAQHSLSAISLALNNLWGIDNVVSFTANRDRLTYLSIRDLMNPHSVSGSTNKNSIKLAIPQIRDITVEEYMHYLNSSGVDIAPSLSEEAPLSAGKHRAERSAKNALVMLNKCLSLRQSSYKLLGSIQGGNNVEARVECAKAIRNESVDGFLIGGFGLGESGPRLREIVKAVSKELEGDERMVVLSGEGRPSDIIFGAMHGVDLFECAYPFILANEAKALNVNFNYSIQDVPEIEDRDYIDNTLNLQDKEYKFDQHPIMVDCSCEACRGYSRGYIHHLLEVNEMTAYVLLSKHNVHIMSQLLDRIRQAKEAQELSYLFYHYTQTQCS